MKKLAVVPEKDYVNYIVRKLQAWYHCFRPKPVDPADKAEQAAVAEAEAEVNGGAAPVDGLLLSDAE